MISAVKIFLTLLLFCYMRKIIDNKINKDDDSAICRQCTELGILFHASKLIIY
jgi:hypothetical protein